MRTWYLFFAGLLLQIHSMWGEIPCSSPLQPVDGIFRKIVVVIPSYNNKDWYKRNLDSIFSQAYPRDAYHVIYVDDFSPDGTGDLVEAYIKEHNLGHMTTLIKNKTRRYKMANLYDAIHQCDPAAIIFEMDGDDWADHVQVFALINNTYANKNIWMTYGNLWEWPTNRAENWIHEVPKDLVKRNAFREVKVNIWTAQRTFYAWLFQKIDKKDLQWPDGTWLQMSSDVAMMFCMFEMAGDRFKFIKERIYVHNVATPINDHKVNPQLQYQIEQYVRSKRRYQRLPDSAAPLMRH